MDDPQKEVLNNLLKGAAFTAIGLFFSKAMGFLYRIIVGRYIGPEAYGQLSIGIMILGFAKAFSGGALDNALMKFIPEYREKEDQASVKGVVISSIGISLVLSILIGVLTFISADIIAARFFGNPGLEWVIQTFGLLTIVSSLYDRLIEATLGFNTAKYETLIPRILQNAIQITATLILVVVLGKGLSGALIAWITATAVSTALAFYALEIKLGPVLLSNYKPNYHARELILFSYPLFLSGIIGTIQGWADTALIGFFMQETAVGLYNAAYPIAMLILLPGQALGALALSSLSELSANKETSASDSLKTLTNWTFALVFPAFLIMSLFSEEIILALFGRDYVSVAPILPVLAFGNLVAASVGKLASYLKSKEHTELILNNTLITVLTNLGLNIYLIPRYGVMGAAIATAVSGIIAEIILLMEAYRSEKVTPFHRNMIKTIVSGFLALVLTYLGMKLAFPVTPVWALFPASGFFFLIHLLIFARIGGLEEYEKEIIVTAARKVNLEEQTRKILEALTP